MFSRLKCFMYIFFVVLLGIPGLLVLGGIISMKLKVARAVVALGDLHKSKAESFKVGAILSFTNVKFSSQPCCACCEHHLCAFQVEGQGIRNGAGMSAHA